MREGFVFYRSFADALKELPAEQCKEVLTAMCDYALDDKQPDISGVCAALFALMKPQIDANNKRRENGKAGAEYGKMGGRPKKETPNSETETPKKPQENPNETPNSETETPKEKVKDKDKDIKRKENIKEKRNGHQDDRVYVTEFDQLWERYPRKQGKPVALKAYIKARQTGTSYGDVFIGISNYNAYIKANNIEQRYIKQGATWFNQQCWNDDYTSRAAPTTADIAPLMTFDEFM